MDLAQGASLEPLITTALAGLVRPGLPNGGWSLTIELHFYLLLPALLWLFRRDRRLPFALLAAAILFRAWLWRMNGEVQNYAYWTLIGRLDQFVLGMAAFHYRHLLQGRHALVLTLLGLFWGFYAWFDAGGGYYHRPSYPSPGPLWIILGTVEGLAYAILIAWYANSFKFGNGGLSGFLGKVGEWSYSIYLLHFFFVFEMAAFINARVTPLDRPLSALAWSVVAFLAVCPVAWFSYRFLESPFLKLRRPYLLPSDGQPVAKKKKSRS
jgi:peptidoglycan/LPS O-acetylase OafA/YrhL